MGKKLIIKGADFSQNAIAEQIHWYVKEVDNAIATANELIVLREVYYGVTPLYNFGGKTINLLRFKAAKSGTLKIFSGTSYQDTNPTLLASVPFTASEGQIVEINLSSPIVVQAGHILWFGKYNVAADALFYAPKNQITGLKFKAQCGLDSFQDAQSTLLLDIGYKNL